MLDRKSIEIKSEVTLAELFEILRVLTVRQNEKNNYRVFHRRFSRRRFSKATIK